MTSTTSHLFISFLFLFQTSVATHLFLQAPIRDRSEKLKFGQATCISNDGRRIAIGANGYHNFRGAMYVYDLALGDGHQIDHWRRTTIVGNDTRPAEQKKPSELRVVERGSGFGFSCALTPSGEHLVIGAPGHSLQRGTVYIYSYDASLKKWLETHKLGAPDLKSGDLFGWVVVVSDDCRKIAVSAKGRRANNGEVFIFSCQHGCVECHLSDKLTPLAYTDAAGPRGIRIRNNFGISLAMNQEGTLLAVGCIGYNEESGAVYVYGKHKQDDKWNSIQRIESPNAQKYGFFGYKLSMDSDGQTLAVGADGEKQYTGAVYLFRKQTVNASVGDYEYVQEATRKKKDEEDNFGGAVALSADGRALLIGAPGKSSSGLKDHGVAYLFEEVKSRGKAKWKLAETVGLPPAHSSEQSFFGWAVGVSSSGGRFVATAPNSHSSVGLAAFGSFKLSTFNGSSSKCETDSSTLENGRDDDFAKDEL